MSAAWFVIGVAGLVGLICAYCFVEGYGYKRGYEAGQTDERRAINRVLNGIQERGLVAQRDIDYLYERARWQIERYSSDSSDRNSRDARVRHER
jgi:hypothetical protein